MQSPSEGSVHNFNSGLPQELIAAVAAPWRSTHELEAIRAKARSLSHYDIAMAAHDILLARKKEESQGAVRVLWRGQLFDKLETDKAALKALTAVDNMWNVHLDHLRKQNCKALQTLQDKHEEALTKMRLQQAARANDCGLRPEKRNKELLNFRRSESVLAAMDDFRAAAKVKAHADEIAATEACSSHASWLLKCHGEQERLMARQRKELEALQKRLDGRLREVEVASERGLGTLQRKIKVNSSHQQRNFSREKQFLKQALKGDLMNTITTRRGRGLGDALPTFMQMAAAKQPGSQPGARLIAGSVVPPSVRATSEPSGPGTGYLGPSSDVAGVGRVKSEGPSGSIGVRFAPTPPRREAWAAPAKASGAGSGSSNIKNGFSGSNGNEVGGSGSGKASSSDSGSGQSRPSSSRSGGPGGEPGSDGPGNAGAEPLLPSRPSSAPAGRKARTAGTVAQVAPPSATTASGATVVANSGSSALTEEALRAMNQAGSAQPRDNQRGGASLQSSSFKSNKPYIVGVSARALAKPASAAAGPHKGT